MMDDQSSPPSLSLLPGGLYLTGEDHLRVNSWGSVAGVTLAIEGRMVDPNGCLIPLAETQQPNSDRTQKTSLITLAQGWLTNVQVRVSGGTVKRGGVFVVIELVRGRTGNIQSLGTLFADYVAGATPLGWPGTLVRSPLEGPGNIRSITGTDPAAGAEISDTVPTGARWRLQAIKATLVADATVVSRQPGLIIDDGANVLWNMNSNATQTAGASWVYVWADIGQSLAGQPSIALNYPLPPLVLPAGSRIRTSTALLQAGDNWGAPQYLVEEWIEP